MFCKDYEDLDIDTQESIKYFAKKQFIKPSKLYNKIKGTIIGVSIETTAQLTKVPKDIIEKIIN